MARSVLFQRSSIQSGNAITAFSSVKISHSIKRGHFFYYYLSRLYAISSFYTSAFLNTYFAIQNWSSMVNFILAPTVTCFPSSVLKGWFHRIEGITFSIFWELAFKYQMFCGFQRTYTHKNSLDSHRNPWDKQRDMVQRVALSLGSNHLVIKSLSPNANGVYNRTHLIDVLCKVKEEAMHGDHYV